MKSFTVAPAPAAWPTTVRRAYRRELPPRYATDVWDVPFRQAIDAHLRAGMAVLDVGAGASPSVPVAERPDDVHYVGLDVSAHELDRAPAGSYAEHCVADATTVVPELEGRFDLVVSWLVLEHVRPVADALACARAYLKPGGVLIAQIAGGRTVTALANRVVPRRVTPWLLHHVQGRDPESIFPAHYDGCTDDGLRRSMDAAGWRDYDVRPLHTGAGYFLFTGASAGLYLGLEELIVRRRLRNLAAFYLVTGRHEGEAS